MMKYRKLVFDTLFQIHQREGSFKFLWWREIYSVMWERVPGTNYSFTNEILPTVNATDYHL